MPHYSRQNNLFLEGAFLDIIVYPPVAVFNKHLAEKTQCPTVSVKALIDTGASQSCVDDESVAKVLSLIARDKIKVGNTGGHDEQYLYDAGFKLPLLNTGIMPLQIFGVVLTGQPYKALIGRDVLRHGNSIYSGVSNFWSFSL